LVTVLRTTLSITIFVTIPAGLTEQRFGNLFGNFGRFRQGRRL